MEKTVVVVCGNSLSAHPSGDKVTIDLSSGKFGKGSSAADSKITLVKSLWTCSLESVVEYCRIVFDLFPDQYQVCVCVCVCVCVSVCLSVSVCVCVCQTWGNSNM